MPTFDGDPPHRYDPNCGCDACLADDPLEAWFAGAWAEILADDPRDVQSLYDGLVPCGMERASRSATNTSISADGGSGRNRGVSATCFQRPSR